MKNQKKALFIMLILLLVVVMAYFVITNVDFTKEEEAEETVSLISIDSQSVQSISLSNENGELYFVCDADTATWSDNSEEARSLDSSSVDYLCYCLSEVVTQESKVIKGVTDLSEYGLDDPGIVCSLVTSDGTYEIRIGDQTVFGDGGYYALNAADPSTVYLISSSEYSSYNASADDYVSAEETEETTETTQ